MRQPIDFRSFAVRRISEAMRYGPTQFKEDWDTVLALSQLMAVHGPFPYQESQAEDCMNRILAYLANNPDALPWKEASV
jgi:hypothetical protein